VIGLNDQDVLAEFLDELVASHAVEPESNGELIRE